MKNRLHSARAFLRGMYEFRLCVTWADPARVGYDYTPLDQSYDRGRELAHRITFRRWDA